jgi:Flp pilus assembly protein TadG
MLAKINALFRNIVRNDGGFAAVEFALVFPTMVLMYFGMLDLTQFITVSRRVQAAAGVTADLVTANEKAVSSAQVTDYFNAADMILAPMTPSKIRVEIFTFKSDGSLRWSANNGRGSNCGSQPTSSSFSSMISGTPANDVTVARVCTDYQPFFGQFMGTTLLGTSAIKLTKTMYQRPRLSPSLCLGTAPC